MLWCVWRITDLGEISNSPHTGPRPIPNLLSSAGGAESKASVCGLARKNSSR
jgi:hypothetical protein